jgi:CheY-like chemotaxis protein
VIARRVLVVDDEPAVRHIVVRLLRMAGYEANEAQSGEEALEILESTGADIVLVDLEMPGMSGQTLFHAARSRWPELAGTLIVMSGDPEAPGIVEWIALHGVPVLVKPFGRTELLEAVESFPLPRRRLNRVE